MKEKRDRNLIIIAKIKAGQSLRSIGAEFSIVAERVRAIYRREMRRKHGQRRKP